MHDGKVVGFICPSPAGAFNYSVTTSILQYVCTQGRDGLGSTLLADVQSLLPMASSSISVVTIKATHSRTAGRAKKNLLGIDYWRAYSTIQDSSTLLRTLMTVKRWQILGSAITSKAGVFQNGSIEVLTVENPTTNLTVSGQENTAIPCSPSRRSQVPLHAISHFFTTCRRREGGWCCVPFIFLLRLLTSTRSLLLCFELRCCRQQSLNNHFHSAYRYLVSPHTLFITISFVSALLFLSCH